MWGYVIGEIIAISLILFFAYLIYGSFRGGSAPQGGPDEDPPPEPPEGGSPDDDPLPKGGGGGRDERFNYIEPTEAINRELLSEEEKDIDTETPNPVPS